MSKLMVKDGDIWVPMEGLKGDTGPLPADESIPDTALVTDGAKTNTAYLMRNRLTKDDEGELISVEDSYAVPPVSLSVDGKSTQVTTTGKNLCPHKRSQWSYIRLSRVGGGEVVASGGTRHYCVVLPLAEGQSIHWHRNGLTGSPGYFRTCSDYPPVVGTTISAGVTLTNYANYTLTNNDGTKPCAMLFSTGNGMPYDVDLERMQAQLEYGTSFTSYEPYSGGVASPSPEWSQDITSVDSASVSVHSKNLIDGSVGAWESGSMNANGNEEVNTKRIRMTGYLKLANGTYTLSVADGWTVNAINIFDKNKNFATRFLATDRNVSTFSMSSETEGIWEGSYIRVFFGKADNSDITPEDVLDAKPMLVLGSTEMEYEPYSGATATLDLSDEPLRSLPDGTKDELHLTYIRPSTREGWAYYRGEKIKRVATRNCSGNENWKIYRNYAFYAAMPSARVMKTGKKEVLCNAYKSDASTSLGSAGTSATSPNTIFGRNGETDAIIKTIVAYNTVNDFKAALAENPITIQYPLATPETIDLGIFELPAMRPGTTNLWSDPSTNLSVTYERDRNIVITNLKAAVADLATS